MRRCRSISPARWGAAGTDDVRSHRPSRAGRALGLRDLSPDAPLQLAHRRLSIIDLSTASDQPFVKDGLHLSYNGELYNYRELRKILRDKGVRFSTESDTEVVLECLAALGTRRSPALSWDVRVRALRRAQPQPSRWSGIHSASSRCTSCHAASGILFASELKALVAAVGPGTHRRSSMRSSRPPCSISCRRNSPPSRRSSSFRPDRGPSGVPTAPSAAGRYWDPAEEALAAAAGPTADLGRRCSRSRSRRTWWPMCRSPPFSAAAWTRASSPRWPRAATPPSRPTPSRSVPRISVSRRCPTTPSTPARWPRTWVSDCTRSRSARTSWTCSLGSWTSSTSPSATRPRSTPCSCARLPGTPASRSCCREWARTSCSAVTASIWPAFWGRSTRRSRSRFAPAWLRRAWTGSLLRPAGAGFGTAGGPSVSSASPSCRRRRPSAAATPSTTRPSFRPCSIPS